MYSNWPMETIVNLSADQVMQQNGVQIPTDQIPGLQLNANLQIENQKTPTKVALLLQKFGWKEAGTHPDTQQQMWQKQPPDDASDEKKAGWDDDLKRCYWMWYEAMAYEFGKFMSIGDDVDWSKSQGSATMGSAASPNTDMSSGR